MGPLDGKESIIYLVVVFSIVPLILILSNWQKIINPIIEFIYETVTIFRKREYLPPHISIEGYGIKRGLSTVKAALLSEIISNEILGMLLIITMEKDALRIKSLEPLKIEMDKILPDTLNKNERDFVRICNEKNRKKRRDKLANLLIEMIRTVSNEMRGFSLKETVDYYKTAVNTAAEKSRDQGIQNIVNLLVGDFNEFTKKVTNATNPYADAPTFEEVPEFMKHRSKRNDSGRSGGHVGCACAGCACAGCACACAGCACACAGGGR